MSGGGWCVGGARGSNRFEERPLEEEERRRLLGWMPRVLFDSLISAARVSRVWSYERVCVCERERYGRHTFTDTHTIEVAIGRIIL